MLSEQDDTLTPSLHKRTRLVGYKDPMNPSIKNRFTIFILYNIFIFIVSP
jgi:hypothetical protein